MSTLDVSPSVLLSFRASNVRSFREEIVFSLQATALAEPEARLPVRWRDSGATVDVLPAAGVFGANASGKSNLLRVMHDMRTLVLGSFRHGRPAGGIPRRPFLLDPNAAERPSEFEVDLVLHGVRHRYGFAINSSRVLEEWAFQYPKGQERLIFSRDHDELEIGSTERAKSRAVREILRPNALFLSTSASANHPVLLPLYNWFERNFLLAEAQSRDARQALTASMLEMPEVKDEVLAFIQEADLGISGVAVEEVDPEVRDRMTRAVAILMEGVETDQEEESGFEPPVGIYLEHKGRQGAVRFGPGDESLGTLVWFGIVGPIVHALKNGSVFLADELDASLHPTLVAFVVALFQNRQTNPHRAQLVFNSHDTSLLGDAVGVRITQGSGRLLGRDQIWFTEKENDGSSRVYPLSDMSPRKGEAIERRYIAGRYGAVPILPRSPLGASASVAEHEYATQ